MHSRFWLSVVVLVWAFSIQARQESDELFFVTAKAKNKIERTRIANAGIAIDAVLSDSVHFLATKDEITKLKSLGVDLEYDALPDRSEDFPINDAAYHNYAETLSELKKLEADYPALVKQISVGKSLEGRDLAGVRISSKPTADSLPTAIFLGCHHAREHLSVEVPLMIARYLASQYAGNEKIRKLLDTREVWIAPMMNPDGAEYDIASGSYRMWRKNRRPNGDGSFGVDMNRNYAKGFGGPGSSGQTSSDIYRGTKAFSEPETASIRDFIRARKKTTVLISFHTYSELVLWPWGSTFDPISNNEDRRVFETLGKQMAGYNGYKPQKSSELYLASGDTTDWAYDELKIFAFTFELSPTAFGGGGFYPGPGLIEPTFKANIQPVLLLIDKAENPYSISGSVADPLDLLG